MNLKQIINGKNLKVLEVARRMKISSPTLSLWINGWVVPNETQVKSLAKTLDVSTQEIELAVQQLQKSREGNSYE